MTGQSRRSGNYLVPVLLSAAFLLLNAGGWWYYRNTESSLAETVGTRLTQATRLVAQRIDPEQIILAAEPVGDLEAIIYLDTVLQSARESGEFASLLLLAPDGSELLGESGDTSQGRRDVVASAAGAAFDAASAGVSEVSQLYSSRGSYFLAACIPVLDYDSTVLAVVTSEAGNDYFEALEGLRQGLLLLDLFAAMLMLTLGLVWIGAQRRLARAEDAAQRSAQLAAMGQMVATVAHELKNPLGIIKNTAERLRRKFGHNSDDPIFDFIPEEVDRLDRLLHRYLQFARLDVGEVEAVDLVRFARQVQGQIAPGDAEGPVLNVQVPEGLAVAADPGALRQVVLNLVLNAMDACRRKGGGEVSLAAESRGLQVEIVIADTGIGMDSETLRQAAEPFFTTRPDGSGLGIYLARTLTEKMNGKMNIRSRAGEGTWITLALPAASLE